MAALCRLLAAATLATHAAGATYRNPVLNRVAPDPGVLWDAASEQYVAASTGDNSPKDFPLWTSKDLGTWSPAGVAFGPGRSPSWSSSNFWAPEVHVVDGAYMMYFTARNTNGVLCIGVAKSTTGSVLGPYEDALGHPLLENPAKPGTIDAHFFKDPASGEQFLLWKLDGNDAGQRTPIFIAPLSQNGTVLLDAPKELISNDLPWEGPLVEAPWLYLHEGRYWLFYSANIFGDYAVGAAHGPSPRGPFTKLQQPVLSKAAGAEPAWWGPGHCSVVTTQGGATVMLYHAWSNAAHTSFEDPRYMMMEVVDWVKQADGLYWPTVAGGVPSSGEHTLPASLSIVV